MLERFYDQAQVVERFPSWKKQGNVARNSEGDNFNQGSGGGEAEFNPEESWADAKTQQR